MTDDVTEESGNLSSEDSERNLLILRFLTDLFRLLEDYRDINPSEILLSVKSQLKNATLKRVKEKEIVIFHKDELEKIRRMPRDELIQFLNNDHRFQSRSQLQALAKSFKIRNVSRMSMERLRNTLIHVVYDRPHELSTMIGYPKIDEVTPKEGSTEKDHDN